jgi:hypothetical protein
MQALVDTAVVGLIGLLIGLQQLFINRVDARSADIDANKLGNPGSRKEIRPVELITRPAAVREEHVSGGVMMSRATSESNAETTCR